MIRFKYILKISLLLISNWVFAQTVVIPDTAFRACLVHTAPTAFDVNQRLILSEASKVTGFVSCIGKGISTVEGIQYLTGIKELNLSSNFISQIDAFPVSDSLARLVIDDNLLTQLPDLSVLHALKTLVVRRNKLTSLPSLSTNTKLTQLYVQSNQLTSLPELKNLKDLWAVNFSSNKLTSLPQVDSLKKLTELVVSNNQLKSLQSLENLKVLTYLDVSGNRLSALPKVATSNLIETVKIDNNEFESLPDFSVFPKLTRAYLNNNYFTFNDLYPLRLMIGYDTIFPLSTQKLLKIGQDCSLKIGDEKYLKTGVDLDIVDVKYTWYFKDTKIQAATIDSVKVLTLSDTLSGYYYCQLTNSFFPNLILKTDSVNININGCFELNDVVVDVTPKTCIHNSGSIEVKMLGELPASFQYELISTDMSEVLTSKNGEFLNLGNSTYNLFGKTAFCKTQLSTTIEITESDCDNVFITADNDGVDDEYFFSDTGEVIISDKFGNTVFQLPIPSKWDGASKQGKVAPGLYYANINEGEKLIKITVVY